MPSIPGRRPNAHDGIRRAQPEPLRGCRTDGFDILCSCPTCSFMLRSLHGRGSLLFAQYQDSVGADDRFIKVPVGRSAGETRPDRNSKPFDKIIFKNILRTTGYFSSLDPLKRVMLLEKTFDLGEYLLQLARVRSVENRLQPDSGARRIFPPLPPTRAGIRPAVYGTAGIDSRPGDGIDRGQPLLLRDGGPHGVQTEFPPGLDRAGPTPGPPDPGDGPGDPGDRLPQLPAAVQPAPAADRAPPGRTSIRRLRRPPIGRLTRAMSARTAAPPHGTHACTRISGGRKRP